jgi:opacity protein-like surface antigen
MLTVGAMARAQDYGSGPTGLYLGVGAGLNQPVKSDSRLRTGNTDVPTVFDFGTGYNIVGALGYKWNTNFRTELEFDYRHAGMDRINGFGANGAQKVYSFSGNLLYDIPLGRITPYVGGGLGVARSRWSDVNAGFNTANFNSADTKLQWQLIGGVSMPIAARTAVFVDYRYIGVSSAHYTDSVGDIVDRHSDRSHNVVAGLRFFF